MTWLPSKLGAEPKKIAILGGLLAVAGVVYWTQRTPSPDASSTPAPVPAAPVAATPPTPNPLGPRTAPSLPMPARRTAGRGESRTVADFKPTLKPQEGIDISRIDPTLQLDRLAKLRALGQEGGARSIFEFSQAAPPPTIPKVEKIKVGPVQPPAPPKAASNDPAAKPPAPPPPPIPLKFYGYANTPKNGPKRAFFLDGDDIFVAGENDVIRNRYKIIRIGVNSAVVEDTSNKNQQTLPLIEELAG